MKSNNSLDEIESERTDLDFDKFLLQIVLKKLLNKNVQKSFGYWYQASTHNCMIKDEMSLFCLPYTF